MSKEGPPSFPQKIVNRFQSIFQKEPPVTPEEPAAQRRTYRETDSEGRIIVDAEYLQDRTRRLGVALDPDFFSPEVSIRAIELTPEQQKQADEMLAEAKKRMAPGINPNSEKSVNEVTLEEKQADESFARMRGALEDGKGSRTLYPGNKITRYEPTPDEEAFEQKESERLQGLLDEAVKQKKATKNNS